MFNSKGVLSRTAMSVSDKLRKAFKRKTVARLLFHDNCRRKCSSRTTGIVKSFTGADKSILVTKGKGHSSCTQHSRVIKAKGILGNATGNADTGGAVTKFRGAKAGIGHITMIKAKGGVSSKASSIIVNSCRRVSNKAGGIVLNTVTAGRSIIDGACAPDLKGSSNAPKKCAKEPVPCGIETAIPAGARATGVDGTIVLNCGASMRGGNKMTLKDRSISSISTKMCNCDPSAGRGVRGSARVTGLAKGATELTRLGKSLPNLSSTCATGGTSCRKGIGSFLTGDTTCARTCRACRDCRRSNSRCSLTHGGGVSSTGAIVSATRATVGSTGTSCASTRAGCGSTLNREGLVVNA